MPTVVAVIVGGMLGAAWIGRFGALIGAALAWLVLRSIQHDRRISSLQADLKALRQQQDADAAPAQHITILAPPVRPVPVPAAAPTAPVVATSQPPAPKAHDEAEVTQPMPPPTSLPPRRQAAPAMPDPFAPSKAGCSAATPSSRSAWASCSSAWRSWPSSPASMCTCRSSCGWPASPRWRWCCSCSGWRLRHPRAGYAQVLQGGAVAVLYLTLFVAFRFYGVLAVGAGVRADGAGGGAGRGAGGAAGRQGARRDRRARRLCDAAAGVHAAAATTWRCSATTWCSTWASRPSPGTAPGVR